MARSGGRSQWERQQAALSREIERQQREQAKLAKEREKAHQQQHVEAQQHTAEAKTVAVEQQGKVLDEVLTGILSLPALTFDALKVTPVMPRFDPGPMGVTEPSPDWKDYAVPEPGALSRLFGGAAKRERQVAEAQARFEAAMSAHRQREANRERALSQARTGYDRMVGGIRAKAAADNAALEARRTAFAAGDPEGVEWFVSRVLDASRYPDGFPHQYQVAYRPENRDVVVEFELPPQKVVPAVRGYRYVKARDAIDPLPRPAIEIKQRYARQLLLNVTVLIAIGALGLRLQRIIWRRHSPAQEQATAAPGS